MKLQNKSSINDQIGLFFILIGIITFACSINEPEAIVTVPHDEVEITYYAQQK